MKTLTIACFVLLTVLTAGAQTNTPPIYPWLPPAAPDSLFNRASTWYAQHGISNWVMGQTAPVPTTNQLAAINRTDVTRWRNGGIWSNGVAYVRTGTIAERIVTDRSISTNLIGGYTEQWIYGMEWFYRNLMVSYGCDPDDSFDINKPKLTNYTKSITNNVDTKLGVVMDGVDILTYYIKLGSLGSDFKGSQFKTNQVPRAVYTRFE